MVETENKLPENFEDIAAAISNLIEDSSDDPSNYDAGFCITEIRYRCLNPKQQGGDSYLAGCEEWKRQDFLALLKELGEDCSDLEAILEIKRICETGIGFRSLAIAELMDLLEKTKLRDFSGVHDVNTSFAYEWDFISKDNSVAHLTFMPDYGYILTVTVRDIESGDYTDDELRYCETLVSLQSMGGLTGKRTSQFDEFLRQYIESMSMKGMVKDAAQSVGGVMTRVGRKFRKFFSRSN